MDEYRRGDFTPRIFTAAEQAVDSGIVPYNPTVGGLCRFVVVTVLSYPVAAVAFMAGIVAGVAVASFRNGMAAAD